MGLNQFQFLLTFKQNQLRAESLRAERKAKIDELNEKTNYYITQQLIQVSDIRSRNIW